MPSSEIASNTSNQEAPNPHLSAVAELPVTAHAASIVEATANLSRLPAASKNPVTAVADSEGPGQATVVTAPADVVVADVRTATIVRGDSLWRLSRRFYRDGMRYRQIYAANSSQIRNPSLIYPGQIFVVPTELPLAQ